MVVADLKNVVKDLVEDDQFPSINVEIIDNDLAKIFANSIKGEVWIFHTVNSLYVILERVLRSSFGLFQNEFRDYPLLLRQAISLARRLQDPLIEYSQLCSSDEEILCLRFHPLQVKISLFNDVLQSTCSYLISTITMFYCFCCRIKYQKKSCSKLYI